MTRHFTIGILAVATVSACSSEGPSEPIGSKVESNGLTRAINALVPDTLLAAIEALGMPVYRGAEPPSIEGSFRGSPMVLVASTVPGDFPPGHTFLDYLLRLSEQDDEALTISVDNVNGPQRGEGIGGFIVGSDGSFTVFASMEIEIEGNTASALELYSGTLDPQGIAEFHYANFMLDDRGNTDIFIPNGTGRVGRDENGFSDRIPDFTASMTVPQPGVSDLESVRRHLIPPAAGGTRNPEGDLRTMKR